MQDIKKNIESKINDIDQMLNELTIDEIRDANENTPNPEIDIEELDVVDVLHNILN